MALQRFKVGEDAEHPGFKEMAPSESGPWVRLADVRRALLSDEAIDAAEGTSSRRAYRSASETERYKQRCRAVVEAAFDKAAEV